MFLRSCALAVAVFALAGCVSSGYDGAYNYYPGGAYYDGPYYDYYGGPFYGGFGHHSYFDDDDDDRYFSPAHGVTCDRVRDLCYDRDGRRIGDREAKRAHKRYDDTEHSVSPKPDVTCDQRTGNCKKERRAKRVHDDEQVKPRDQQAKDHGNFARNDEQARPRLSIPKRENDVKRDDAKRMVLRPVDTGKPKREQDGDRACPPQGCQNK